MGSGPADPRCGQDRAGQGKSGGASTCESTTAQGREGQAAGMVVHMVAAGGNFEVAACVMTTRDGFGVRVKENSRKLVRAPRVRDSYMTRVRVKEDGLGWAYTEMHLFHRAHG